VLQGAEKLSPDLAAPEPSEKYLLWMLLKPTKQNPSASSSGKEHFTGKP
jgi:hypothetical protein